MRQKAYWSIKQLGHNGLNVLDHVYPPDDEYAPRITAAKDWNTKKQNVYMPIILVFIH